MNVNGTSGFKAIFHKKSTALDRTISEKDLVGAGGGDSISWGEAALAGGGGALLGAGIGAGIGALHANSLVNKVPVQSVTETWRVPVTTDKVIGNIPHEQYFPASHVGDFLTGNSCNSSVWDNIDRPSVNPDMRATEPVTRPVPTLDAHGDPVYQEVTKTFSGHGVPTVHTDSHVVTTPSLSGFHQYQTDDTHLASCDEGTHDSNGNEDTGLKSVLDGVRVQFSPDVKDTPVNSADNHYITHNVTFDSGVSTGSIIAEGALIGAGIGAVAGLAGDIAKQTLLSRHS